MDLKNKNILLIGLATTGISVVRKLHSIGSIVTVTDIKSKDTLSDILESLQELENIKYILGTHPKNVDEFDLVVISPGVPLSLPFVKKIQSLRIPIIGEVELAYILSNKPTFVGITGTNGKTTTTSIVGAICKAASKDTFIVGNIGTPVIDAIDLAKQSSILVTELSSFQLDSIDTFKPYISCILNFAEDHLNRYDGMSKYIESKASIFKNQTKHEYSVLNYDDTNVRDLINQCPANVIPFSRVSTLDRGVFVKDNELVVKIDTDEPISIISKLELSLPGEHNVENALASIAITYLLGIDVKIIKETLSTFSNIEHRLEYVDTIGGVDFYNDSKATNPDSTIKAITSFSKPLILIAGGQSKDNEFNELISLFKENQVKELVLLGETALQIKDTATELGFNNCHITQTMGEAVRKALSIAASGDIVLLSPACASKDMFKDYEERGRIFKDSISKLEHYR